MGYRSLVLLRIMQLVHFDTSQMQHSGIHKHQRRVGDWKYIIQVDCETCFVFSNATIMLHQLSHPPIYPLTLVCVSFVVGSSHQRPQSHHSMFPL